MNLSEHSGVRAGEAVVRRVNLPDLFGWFASSDCPADFAAKTWVEQQMEWLSNQFPDWLHEHPVVEPTQKFFPDEYDRSPRAVRLMLDRV